MVVLGEEWQTAATVSLLNDMLCREGIRKRVVMFWNANNTFSFDRIDWAQLQKAATISTVSKYMKHIMSRMGLNPIVIPNGIPTSLLAEVDEGLVREVRKALDADLLLCKIARWDPDKRWNASIEAIARLKEGGMRPVLVARGGIEAHGQEVTRNALALGLTVKEATVKTGSPESYLSALREAAPADVVDVKFHLPLDFLRILYRAADGVLANSGHEPFGIVGLEAMAAGGIAFTGCTGEDYAIPFVNALVLETGEPLEIVGYLTYLREHPDESERIRRAARETARYFTWEAALNNLISKVENQARIQDNMCVDESYSRTKDRRPMNCVPVWN
ncbi:MAG: glycosyltransferase [Dehalococcoidia bacterium]|nr:glycosyltransferase [Dehalococcoidia bacterium]